MRTPKAQQSPEEIVKAVKLLEARLNIADDQLAKHSYLAEYVFTLADTQLGQMLYRYYDIEINQADLQNLSAYYQWFCAPSALSKLGHVFQKTRARLQVDRLNGKDDQWIQIET